jgi:predicted phosphodiesterase
MRLAIFSDVHGNLEGLQAFLERVHRQNVDRFCCLGDLVGYGPNPNECVDLIRSLGRTVVTLGNHDWAALDVQNRGAGLNPMALEALRWTNRQLGPEQRLYLERLKPIVDTASYTFAHASAYQPMRWDYLLPRNFWKILQCFRAAAGRLIFVGHTHAPLVMNENGDPLLPGERYPDGTEFRDDGRSRLIINPGSIGQPRDDILKPCYLIYDTQELVITWYRLSDYDPEPTVRKIIQSDLPEECAWQLLH